MSPHRPRAAAWAGAALLAAVSLLALSACTPAHGRAASRDARTKAPGARRDPAAASAPGSWYAFEGGRIARVPSPAAPQTALRPWTVQAHAAGFLPAGSELYVAVNGWGIASLSTRRGDRAAPRLFGAHRLFAGRTINGFVREGDQLLVHLYRNTVFAAPPPTSSPLTYAIFDPKSGSITGRVLAPSRTGWQAVDVIHTRAGKWALAWKRSASGRTKFRYSLYDPGSGAAETIGRSRFFASYDFGTLARAPQALGRLERLVVRASSSGHGRVVIDLELHGAPYRRTRRFRVGPARQLAEGNARLLTVPIGETSRRYYALLGGGKLLWASRGGGASGALRLPPLPRGYSYTGFWTNGRLLVASWERQRFTDVGAAGLYRVGLSALRAAERQAASGG